MHISVYCVFIDCIDGDGFVLLGCRVSCECLRRVSFSRTDIVFLDGYGVRKIGAADVAFLT